MLKSKENCVELNIFVECEKSVKHGGKGQYDISCKPDDDDTCITINVYVECEKEKEKEKEQKKPNYCSC